MTKDNLLNSLQDLPEEFQLQTLIERLISLQKVEEAIQQVKEGKTFTEAEARQRLAKRLQ